ncbi:amino acid synthesis family protein, partial [Mesorhizobium sp. M7A.F.Ca.AU.001.01.1.1]
MTGVLIRKIVDFVEDTLVEGGRAAPVPLRMAACAAVIRNPWAGSAFVEDLQPHIM